MTVPTLSIIVPVLDEAEAIAGHLAALAPLRAAGAEVIVVDGGSRDGTAERAALLADTVLRAQRGRAAQMNAGAAVARGSVLLFLHADTVLPAGAMEAIRRAVAGGALWGRFDVSIRGRPRLLRLIGACMNLRSRLTGIATGDQAIFVRTSAFREVGGYPSIALMEDVALSARLRHLGRPACLREQVTTSGRRWEQRGVLRTILLMWWLRLGYWLGRHPTSLSRAYGHGPR